MGIWTSLQALGRRIPAPQLLEYVLRYCRIPPHLAPIKVNTTILFVAVTLAMTATSGVYSLQQLLLAQTVVPRTIVPVTSPSLLQSGDGSYLMTFTVMSESGGNRIRVAYSGDGLHWSELEPVTAEFENHWPWEQPTTLIPTSTALIQCRNGSYMIAYTENNSNRTSNIYVTRSPDGRHWSSPACIWRFPGSMASSYPTCRLSLVQGDDGEYEIAFQTVALTYTIAGEYTYGSRLSSSVWTISSRDGKSWDDSRLAYQHPYERILWAPVLQQRPDGSWIIAVREKEQITLMESTDGTPWQTIDKVDAPVPSGYYTGLSLIRRSNGSCLVSFDDGENEVYVAASTGDSDWSDAISVCRGSHPSLISASDGSFMIAFSRDDGVYVAQSSDGHSWTMPITAVSVPKSKEPGRPSILVASLLFVLSGTLSAFLVVCYRRRRSY